jgi:hypothetical protein
MHAAINVLPIFGDDFTPVYLFFHTELTISVCSFVKLFIPSVLCIKLKGSADLIEDFLFI